MAFESEQRPPNDSTPRRGLFRRSRRSESPANTDAYSTPESSASNTTAVTIATIDELARQMEQLLAASNKPPLADEPTDAELKMQHALIARANDLAATAEPTITNTSTKHDESDKPVNENMHQTDIEARMDAALQPIPATVTLDPSFSEQTPSDHTLVAPLQVQDVVPQPVEATQVRPIAQAPVAAPVAPEAALLSHTQPTLPTEAGAAQQLGIDVTRVVQAIEDEALAVHRRIELEMNHAHARSEEVIDRAEAEAERIREHGQAQARVLLSEVEEIISEAQQTGEQILHRANEEAASMRGDATRVMNQAQTEARQIVDTARREGEQVLAEQRRLATVRAQEAMREQERLKDQIRRLEERRRQVLESLEPLISQLTQMMPATPPQNVVHLQRQQPAAQ